MQISGRPNRDRRTNHCIEVADRSLLDGRPNFHRSVIGVVRGTCGVLIETQVKKGQALLVMLASDWRMRGGLDRLDLGPFRRSACPGADLQRCLTTVTAAPVPVCEFAAGPPVRRTINHESN
jgi:hypothetical protein